MGSTPKGISGSRAAAILGESEYCTPREVWQLLKEERTPGWNAAHGMILPPPPDNAAIRWGTAFEDAIVELAEAKHGKQIINRERFCAISPDGKKFAVDNFNYRPDETFVTCHIDGQYAFDSIGEWNALHEGKTTTLFNFWENWGEPGTDRVPRGYQIQAQHQMLCTGAAECIVSLLVFPRRPDEMEKEGIVMRYDALGKCWVMDGLSFAPSACLPRNWAHVIAQMGLFHQYPVAASPSLQAMLVDAYRHFWDHYITGDAEPDFRDYEDIRRAFPEPVGTVVVSEQEAAWLAEYHSIGREISATGRLGRRRDELKVLALKSICQRMGRDSVLDDESQEKVIFRDAAGQKVGSFDGKTMR